MVTLNEYFYQKSREPVKVIGERYRAIHESSLEINKICELIGNHAFSEDYSDVIQDTDDWWVHYHLSDLRQSLLNWYEFQADAQVLEIGAEFGALTGLLCDRCGQVTVTEPSLQKAKALCRRYENRTNLTVYAGEAEHIYLKEWENQFDYIILIGTLERKGYGYLEKKGYVQYLKRILTYLKPDGKMILEADNRYGVRYFCGAREAHTGKAFDGINRYPKGTDGCSFHHKELAEILELAGICHYKFYYPLPDYRMPQLIFTDDYENSINISERLNCYDRNRDTLVAAERTLYEDMVSNHALAFMANSFLVEGCLQGDVSDVIYAVVSTDRGKKYGSATSVHTDGSVKKKALHQEGRTNIRNLYHNFNHLRNRGISVLDACYQEGCIHMPFVKGKGLTQILQEFVVQEKDHFVAVFDEIYKTIKMASEQVAKEENQMKYKKQGMDYGPIMKTAYLDLVPSNCFYQNGSLIFYDQEFVKECYPAKFVLYRGIKYTYMSMWSMNDYLPLEQLKRRYGITEEMWSDFEREEEAFLAQVHSQNIYRQFWEGNRIYHEEIFQRGTLLEYKGEDLTSWDKSTKLHQIQAVEFEILYTVKQICERYQLKYYLFYGTLLGAVRHQGFIPWDDDVDVVMPREDYDKFLEIAEKELPASYFLQTLYTERERFYGGYSKLRDSNSTAIDVVRDWGKSYNKGICIDILPLDVCYQEVEKNEALRKKIMLCQLLIVSLGERGGSLFPEISIQDWNWYRGMAEKIGYWNLTQMLQGFFRSVKEEGAVTVLARFFQNPYPIFQKEWFEPSKKLLFEGVEFSVPAFYQECLSATEGIHYMQYPPKDLRKNKHIQELFVVPDVPYYVYEHRFFDFAKNKKGKSVIVVGHNAISEDFFFHHDSEYHTAFIAEDHPEQIGNIQWGHITKSMGNILEIPEEDRRIIICAENFRHYERLLQDMGIDDYYIYLHDKWWLINSVI